MLQSKTEYSLLLRVDEEYGGRWRAMRSVMAVELSGCEAG
jgi:hypothetical protein